MMVVIRKAKPMSALSDRRFTLVAQAPRPLHPERRLTTPAEALERMARRDIKALRRELDPRRLGGWGR
jgi:hypothetical protein